MLQRQPEFAVRYAVNTHQHGDHCYGNELLPDRTILFGHEHMREGLAADTVIDECPPFWSPVPRWGITRRRLPDVVVGDAATLFLGSKRVELLHPGFPAHTTGDLAVWIPTDRVLFAGDLVFSGDITPLVFMGSVTGARAALEWIERRDPIIVVPGHGPVIVGEEIVRTFDALRRYYDLIWSTAESGLERGWSPLEAARGTDLGEFALWGDSERLALNLHRAYAEIVAGDVDILAAFADALALLGGPMRTAGDMRFLTYHEDGIDRAAVVRDDEVFALPEGRSLLAVLRSGQSLHEAGAEAVERSRVVRHMDGL